MSYLRQRKTKCVFSRFSRNIWKGALEYFFFEKHNANPTNRAALAERTLALLQIMLCHRGIISSPFSWPFIQKSGTTQLTNPHYFQSALLSCRSGRWPRKIVYLYTGHHPLVVLPQRWGGTAARSHVVEYHTGPIHTAPRTLKSEFETADEDDKRRGPRMGLYEWLLLWYEP